MYSITRRGLACVAYPWKGAMRRPECRDRHGGTDSHVFFISTTKLIINAELGSGEANLNFSTMEKLKKDCLYAVSFNIGGTRHETFERFVDGEDANDPFLWVWGAIRKYLRENGPLPLPNHVSKVMVVDHATNEPVWNADIYDITDNNPDDK